MPRHLRYVVSGVPLHIFQRAVNKQTCFGDDRDRLTFVGLLEEHATASGCDVHAFVLMDNHIHLLATPRSENAAASMMKRVLETYSQRFNRKYDRCGTLWGGRYKSSLVDTSTYLLECYRYIELNPVRAGMVAAPRDYRWSSFLRNGMGQSSSSWLTPHPVYMGLGRADEERCENYQAFVAEGIGVDELQAIRIAIRGGFPLGSQAFVDRLKLESGVDCRLGRDAVSAREKVV
jgi:putative transposase